MKQRSAIKIVHDLWLLMKPELTLLSVFTSVCSAYLAVKENYYFDVAQYVSLAIGTLLVGGGAGALNQYAEREYDALMKRTEKRPVPEGRILPNEALLWGIIISIAGIAVLTLALNILSGLLAALTLTTYLFFYTPLKRITSVATIIGAVPGALPILIGWAAVRNEITIEAVSLFAILFYWQMPHFYSIAWLYRNDYARAKFQLLSVIDATGKMLASRVNLNLFLLFLVSTTPALLGFVSMQYLFGAIITSGLFLLYGMKFSRKVSLQDSSQVYASKLFFASIAYLPIIFTLMIIYKK